MAWDGQWCSCSMARGRRRSWRRRPWSPVLVLVTAASAHARESSELGEEYGMSNPSLCPHGFASLMLLVTFSWRNAGAGPAAQRRLTALAWCGSYALCSELLPVKMGNPHTPGPSLSSTFGDQLAGASGWVGQTNRSRAGLERRYESTAACFSWNSF